jgi:hypothetical protein
LCFPELRAQGAFWRGRDACCTYLSFFFLHQPRALSLFCTRLHRHKMHMCILTHTRAPIPTHSHSNISNFATYPVEFNLWARGALPDLIFPLVLLSCGVDAGARGGTCGENNLQRGSWAQIVRHARWVFGIWNFIFT